MKIKACRPANVQLSVNCLLLIISGLPAYSSFHQSVHTIPQLSIPASPFPLSANSAHKIAPPWMEPLTDAQLAEQKALDKAGKVVFPQFFGQLVKPYSL